jgi:hypothetical protein
MAEGKAAKKATKALRAAVERRSDRGTRGKFAPR